MDERVAPNTAVRASHSTCVFRNREITSLVGPMHMYQRDFAPDLLTKRVHCGGARTEASQLGQGHRHMGRVCAEGP